MKNSCALDLVPFIVYTCKHHKPWGYFLPACHNMCLFAFFVLSSLSLRFQSFHSSTLYMAML